MRTFIHHLAFCSVVFLVLLFFYTHSNAQQFSSIWYFSKQPLSEPLASIVYATPENLFQERNRISKEASGVIIEYSVLESYGVKEIDTLRTAVIKEMKFLFAIGDDLPANYLQLKLGIERKVFLSKEVMSEWRIAATGLYQDTTGLINGINIMTLRQMPIRFVLNEIISASSRFKKEKKGPPTIKWNERSSQTEVFPVYPHGRFVQKIISNILQGHKRPDDYWYIHIENTTFPGLDIYNSEYSTRYNVSIFDVDKCKKLLYDGPIGSIGSNMDAKVSIKQSGPTVEWQWNTGKTKINNLSKAKNNKCRWEVDYIKNGQESKKKFIWEPGIELKNEKAQLLVLKIKNMVSWNDGKGGIVETPCDWAHPFTARP